MPPDVFLLSVRLYALGDEAVQRGDVCKVISVENVPVVLNRQIEALLALCHQEESATEL